MKPVLTLNSDMMPIILPIYTLDAQQAINRIVAGTCYVIHSYDKEIKTAKPDQLDAYNLRRWPSIIARHDYLKRQDGVAISTKNLFYRDEGKCRYCGKELSTHEATVDHYVPRYHGGNSKWNNIVLSCTSCNSAKGNSLPTGKWRLTTLPHEPNMYEIMNKKLHFPVTIYDKMWLEFLPTWQGKVNLVE